MQAKTTTPKASKSATPKAKTATPKPSKQAAKPALSDEQRAERRALSSAKHTAQTIVAQRTAFGQTSSRDDAYLAFYAKHADKHGVLSVAALAQHVTNPFYTGASKKADDAGAINRQIKAGRVAYSDDGATITLSDKAMQAGRAVLKSLTK